MEKNSDKNNEAVIYKLNVEELLPLLEAAVSSGGKFPFKPSGNSMKPFIRPGTDSVRVVRAETLKKYDIVLYKRENGQFVLHRIMDILPEGYVMCGDNQWTLEYGVSKDMIIAKVSEICRKNRTVRCSSKGYMLCVHLWCDLFALRKLYLKIRSRISKVFGRS